MKIETYNTYRDIRENNRIVTLVRKVKSTIVPDEYDRFLSYCVNNYYNESDEENNTKPSSFYNLLGDLQ